jgi:hypothetical protein
MAVLIAKDELEPLRTEMRDLQNSVARSYAATASGDDLGSPVRDFITHVQTINDWLTNVIADSPSYRALFAQPRHAGADYIGAVKYVRNVSQHVMHVVKPDDNLTLVGGTFGLRVYAHWDEVPPDVHARLHTGTQSLRPIYEAVLRGREVMGTMMSVLRFYFEIVPSIVHRDLRGEWTGFPLMSQPGISYPLHPEEPLTIADGQAWMNDRKPGGDYRLICGQVAVNDVHYVYGHTFVGRHSFAPFFETIEQANRDIGRGFDYYVGDAQANLRDVSDQFADARQGGVLRSTNEITEWATRLEVVEAEDDWCAPGFDAEDWHSMRRLEDPAAIPFDGMAYEVRRARRLNALVPSSGGRS